MSIISPPSSSPQPGAGRLARFVPVVVLVAASVAAYRHRELLDPSRLEAMALGLGIAGQVGFILLYAVAVTLFLPGSVLTIASGVLFGPWLGGGLSMLGAGLGAAASFLIARHLAGEWVARRVTRGVAARLLAGVAAEGWRFVAFVRLVPLFPFSLLNYSLGLTAIRFDHYLITSLICISPWTMAYSWLGYVGKEAASGSATAIRNGMWTVGVLALAALVTRMVRLLRKPAGEELS